MNKNYSDEIPVKTIAKMNEKSPSKVTIDAILNYSKSLQIARSTKGKMLIHLN